MPAKLAEKITDAEYQVMEVLWHNAPMAAADIADLLTPTTRWSLTTVKTLLARLADKGIINHHKDGRRYLYEPTVSRTDYAQLETRQFVDRLFGGRAAPLVAHLAETSGGLNNDDIAELEALLEELKHDDQ